MRENMCARGREFAKIARECAKVCAAAPVAISARAAHMTIKMALILAMCSRESAKWWRSIAHRLEFLFGILIAKTMQAEVDDGF